MLIEITHPSTDYVRLTLSGNDPREAMLFQIALRSVIRSAQEEAVSVAIPAIGWQHRCEWIEKQYGEQHQLFMRASEATYPNGIPDEMVSRGSLSWIYAGKTYRSVTELRGLISTPETQVFDLGTFTVGGDRITVTDPCYEAGIWCAGVIANVQPGDWLAQSVMTETDGWGIRVKQLRIRHADAPADIFETGTFTDTNIDVGVDSGQAGFFDTALYPADPRSDEDNFYDDCCRLTLDHSKPGGGVISKGFGVVTSSGYGDGGYPCHIARSGNGQVIAAFVTFIADEEEEEETED